MRSVVAAMTAYTLELREAEVKLNQNESPFDVPEAMKRDVLAGMAERAWNVYPDFESTALRTALAEANGLAPENVLVGNGSNELLAAAIGAFVGPGTPVVFPRPTFALYEKLVTIAGGLPSPVEFDPSTGVLPLDAMLDAIAAHEGAVAIVCSPNNPTGGVLPPNGVQRLLDSGAMLLLDHAYGDFACHPERSEGPPPLLDRRPIGVPPLSDRRALSDRLITFSTFSKAWGLAALRVGWLAASAQTCREIRKVKLPYSLNVISEAIAVAALQRRELRDANVATIIAERERVANAMRELVDVFPSQANFLTFAVGDAKRVFEELYAQGILIRDVSAYPRLANCLRVSIGTREQNDRFLEALKASL